MINTIFYFVKDLETYRNKLLEEGISSRTIVFVTKERLIMKGGMPFGGMDEDQLKDFIYRTLDGDWLNASIYPYITEQLALIDLSAVWTRIDEVGSLLSSAAAQITLLSGNVESFVTAQATRNDEFANGIAQLQTRVTTVDGKVDAVTSSLTSTIENVATGLINSAGFVTMATLDESLAGVFATNSSSKEAPENCSLQLWSDLPVATTDEYPYLWLKIEQKNAQLEIVSTSYMRITGEDHTYDSLGMCVDAQYANNNSPAAANIHDEYEVGDIYIRIKSTSEAFDGNVDLDHPWVAMTFEGPTDVTYSFNTSKNPATGFAQILVLVSNDNSSLITLSADQVTIEGLTIIDYLTSTYFNQEFENKNLTISESKIKINQDTQMHLPIKISVGEGDPDDRTVALQFDYDGNKPGFGYNGIYKDTVTLTNNVIWNSGFHLSNLVLNDETDPNLSEGEKMMADNLYGGPRFRIGIDPRKRNGLEIDWDADDPYWTIHDMSDDTVESNISTINSEYNWDARKFIIATQSGFSAGERIPAGIYCEGDVEIGKKMGCFKGPAIELYKYEDGERTDYIDVNSVNTSNINLAATSTVKIGNDAGITQNISLPSTEANKHYELVIKNGIIIGCTLVNDSQA